MVLLKTEWTIVKRNKYFGKLVLRGQKKRV